MKTIDASKHLYKLFFVFSHCICAFRNVELLFHSLLSTVKTAHKLDKSGAVRVHIVYLIVRKLIGKSFIKSTKLRWL